MLEILLLISLTRRIGKIVEQKGYKSGGYKVLIVALWFGGEILGAIFGAIVTRGDQSVVVLVYIIALAGAAAGAGIAFAIASNLSVIGPSLLQTETGQPGIAVSKGRLPAPLLWLLWLATNAVANIVWVEFSTLVNPNYDASLVNITNIGSAILAGMIAGSLQWLILVFMLPNAKRWFLAIWIPASIIGWSMVSVLEAVIPNTTMMFLLASVSSGLTLGILEWLILQRYSKIAFWWIPANIVDWVISWALNQSALWTIVSNYVVSSCLFGAAGAIASSTAIVFILMRAYPDERSEPGNAVNPSI